MWVGAATWFEPEWESLMEYSPPGNCKLGIDLFIYIVSALVLLISETQVQKYQLNNEEPASSQDPRALFISD